MLFTKKPKPISGRALLGLPEKERDISKIARDFPLLLLRFVATATGGLLAPGLPDRFWPGLGDSVDSIFYIAFGAVATLSGLCFRMSSSIDNNQHKESMVYAGERFLHSSLQFLTGAVFSYVALMIGKVEIPSDIDVEGSIQFLASLMNGLKWLPDYDWVQLFSNVDVGTLLSSMFGWAAALMYWWAIDIAYKGVETTHNVMWQKFHRPL